MVVIPTGLGILAILLSLLGGGHEREETLTFFPAIFAALVICFLGTIFLAGGALTLVEIARNTKDAKEALRNIGLNNTNTLRGLRQASLDGADNHFSVDQPN